MKKKGAARGCRFAEERSYHLKEENVLLQLKSKKAHNK
jgi:hypothetical protein